MSESLRPELWSRQHLALRRVAGELLRDEHGAEDVVQATWVRALEVKPPRLTLAWLRSVVTSRARDELRRRAVRAAGEVPVSKADPALGPAEVAEELELASRISAALARLREPYRSTLYERYFEEHTPTAIAARSGVPVASVKTRLRRGLALLRADLEDGTNHRDLRAGLIGLATGLASPTSALPVSTLALALVMKKIAFALAAGVGILGLVWLVARGVRPEIPAPEMAEVVAAPSEPSTPLTPVEPAPAATSSPNTRRLVAVPTSPGASAAPAPSGSLLVRMTWFDGTPAKGVGVGLISIVGDRSRPVSREDSNAAGELLFADLAPGRWVVRTDREAEAEARVEAGEEALVELGIPRQLDVIGRVVDPEERPVPGAAIWLTAYASDWLAGRLAGRADEEGRFLLRSVPPQQSVAAIAEGFAPSELVDLELLDHGDEWAEVELVLRPGGAIFEGRVVGDAGAPVPGARIAVGSRWRYFEERANGTRIEEWSPRVGRTDEEGRFRMVGLEPGDHSLAVRAEGFGILRGEIALAAGQSLHRELRLAAGVHVLGIARDGDGEPLAGIEVRGFEAAIPEDFLAGGQYDYYEVFGYALAVTQADGSYRLGPLAAGAVFLYATQPRSRGYYVKSLMVDRHQMHAEPGATLVWDPVIAPGDTIRGRTLYGDDVPMTDVFVTLADETTGIDRVIASDGEGEFAFYNLEPHAYTVSVQLWDPPPDAARPMVTGVRPNGDEVLLQVDYPAPVESEPGAVVGRVDDAGGRLGTQAELGVTLECKAFRYTAAANSDGTFEFDEVEPARYRVVLRSAQVPIGASDWFDVAPGERVDVGALTTRPGGTLEVRVTRDDRNRGLGATLFLRHESEVGTQGIGIDPEQELVRVESLEAGRWTGSLLGKSIVWEQFEVTITPGTTAEVRVHPKPAAEITCCIWWPDGVMPESLILRALTRDGALVHESSIDRAPYLRRPWRRILHLAPGTYDLVVETAEGLTARCELSIEADGVLEDREVRLDVE